MDIEVIMRFSSISKPKTGERKEKNKKKKKKKSPINLRWQEKHI
jgi:hypothetical protein